MIVVIKKRRELPINSREFKYIIIKLSRTCMVVI